MHHLRVIDIVSKWAHFNESDGNLTICGYGHTLSSAFEKAGLAVTALMIKPEMVVPRKRISLVCSANTPEQLFYEWIDNLILESQARRMLFSRFSVEVEDSFLRADLWGEDIDIARHKLKHRIFGVKAAGLGIDKTEDDFYAAHCVVDCKLVEQVSPHRLMMHGFESRSASSRQASKAVA